MPTSYPPVAHPSTRTIALSWIFAFTPLVFFGILNAPVFAYAAARTRSTWLAVLSVGYLVSTIVMFANGGDPTTPTQDVIFTAALFVNMIGGTVHALAIRRWVLYGDRHRARASTDDRTVLEDPAVKAALAKRQRRAQTRQLLATDPQIAAELRIGRPDLPRKFDDGGLVDVNNVSTDVLNRVPGVTRTMAERIVAAARVHELTCVEELVLYADLSAAQAESLDEYLIFRPRDTDNALETANQPEPEHGHSRRSARTRRRR